MQFGNRVLVGVFAGLFLGLVGGVLLSEYSYGSVCPSRTCVDSSEVVPISDRGYFNALHNALVNARESIHIVSFELKYYEGYPDSSMNIIVRDLIEAKKRGIDVKILLDEYSDRDNAYDILVENGVDVKYDSEETTTHAKLVIVDGEVVILGSTNLSYYGLEMNNEVDVLVRDGRIAAYFEDYFWGMWGD